MLRILIADDEQDIVNLIEYFLKNLDVEVIGTALNGLDASRMISELHPDVVLTDIRMPGMTGLEMIEKSRKDGETAEFVVISGYRDFEYAKTALQYGVQDYLLKPVNEKELRQLISRMEQKKEEREDRLQEQQESDARYYKQVVQIRKDFLRKLMSGDRISDAEREILGEDEPLRDIPGARMRVMLVKADCRNRMQSEFGTFAPVLGNLGEKYCTRLCADGIDAEYYLEEENLCCIAFSYDPERHSPMKKRKKYIEEILRGDEERLSVFDFTIALGEEKSSQSGIPQSFRSARAALCSRIVSRDRVIEADRLPEICFRISAQISRETENQMNRAILSMDESAAVTVLRKGLEQACGSGNEQKAYDFAAKWISLSNRYLVESDLCEIQAIPSAVEWQRRISNCRSMEDILEILTRYTKKLIRSCVETQKEHEIRPVAEVKEYIQLHYSEPIFLDTLARHVCLSSVYLSALFKNNTGMTITDYIKEIRISRAEELLEDTNVSIREIAHQVGYQDQRYFSRLFTKTVGLKPNEYRRHRHRRADV